MTLSTGHGARPGVAIAAAARLHVEPGIAAWDPERLRRIALRLRAFGVEAPEPEQVILVADHLPSGPLPLTAGLEVIGIALGSDAPSNTLPDCPAVISLGETWFDSVAEDEIVIVDGSRGRVYVSPDAMTVARYQSPTVAARRIFLDDTFQPARTASDGRDVAVYAAAAELSAVLAGMTAGADGLCWFAAGQLPWTASAQWEELAPVMEGLGGRPLLLDAPREELSLDALARLSALGPLFVPVPDEAAQREIAGRLRDTEALLEEEEVVYGTPQFLRTLRPEESLPEALTGYAGMIFSLYDTESDLASLLPLAGLSRRMQTPLTVILGDDWRAQLPRALMLEARQLLVPPDAVADAKEAIRAW